ncbi:hypothetical protein MTR_4g048280 [Medicago truncatula]|uniref:Transmembrane protein n=1 Tax=Medicago truncatula TaxID=3880 RepID=A0A072UJS5_MEDTR|nr:hypothetical protein MTR_4g048280 [Medicago truncatula]
MGSINLGYLGLSLLSLVAPADRTMILTCGVLPSLRFSQGNEDQCSSRSAHLRILGHS